MNKKNLLLVLIVFSSLIGGIILGNLLSSRANGNSVFSHGGHSKVDDLLSIINNHYVDTVNVNEMTEGLMTDLV